VCMVGCATEPEDGPQSDELAEAATPEAAATDRLVTLYCPGISRADGVPTYKGLTGTYQRFGTGDEGEPYRLVLVAAHDDPDARGTFTGTRIGPNGTLVPYAGAFAALPDNPAIGAVITLDIGDDGRWDQSMFVLGVSRWFGRVTGLCLAGATRPFLMSRTL